ncbi:MAG: VOC family protein [Candidatus Eremiobacteraeota bacterium]|nr:VOC family protein [Candidatus Eremiobacteraeota bacterium]
MSTTHPAGAKTTAKIVGIDIAAYLVRDPQKMIAFYRDVLGMTPTAVDDGGRGAEFTLSDGSTFGVWRPDGVENPSGGTIMFAVENIHDAVAAFNARGAKLQEPFETPVCHMAPGVDPEGNGFIIHQRKNR